MITNLVRPLLGKAHCVGAWTYTRLNDITAEELDESWAPNARSVALTLQEPGDGCPPVAQRWWSPRLPRNPRRPVRPRT
jgi:hypothetical protein